MDANGGANFEETAKYPLSELQVAVEELPAGVDPKCKEVCADCIDSLSNPFHLYLCIGKALFSHLGLSIISFRDIRIEMLGYAASGSIEPGKTVWIGRLA